MTKKIATLQKELGQIMIESDYDLKKEEFIKTAVKSYLDSEGVLCVTSDTGQGFIDYYGEFRDNCPYIAPEIEKFAKDNGMFWEWHNPGSIGLYEG